MTKAKRMLSVLLASTIVLGSAADALACTGIYVGSKFSENGSTYMGRSEDIGDLYGKMFGVAEAAEHDADEIYEDTYGFSMTYGELPTGGNTYRYTYMKDTPKYGETMQDEDGNYIGEAYAEAGMNEHGVAMTATVTTGYNRNTVGKVDPLVDTGICEVSLGTLILGGCKTAREAVEFLAYLSDTYGTGECNSITISDPDETWVFDTVSGHQYVAVKMPKDAVHFNPNVMLVDVVDVTDTKNVVASPELVSLAEENGFLVTDEDGNIDVAATYKGNRTPSTRFKQGMWYLNPELAADEEYVATLPFMFEADRKLSTMDVLRFLATYGEGTPSESLSGQIANNRQSECHIFETRRNVPEEMATIQWQAMADAEFSVYVPYYTNLVTEVHEGYDYDSKPSRGNWNYITEEFLEETEGSINWNFQIINNRCYNNREALEDVVKEYLTAYQESLISQQESIDKQMKKIVNEDRELAEEKATELGLDLAEQVQEMSSLLRDEILAYLNGDMTEPFELSEELQEMEPEYSFDRIGGTGLEDDDDNEVVKASSKPKNYTATVNENAAENGTVELSKTRVKKGGEITVTVTPDAGYELDELVVVDKDGDVVEVTDKGNGKFTFEMPKGGADIVPVFVKDGEVPAEKEEVKAEAKEIVLTIDSVIASVFGEYVANDVAPVIRNGRTMLPARFVAEALGATVAWDEAAQKVTITKGETVLSIFIAEPFATVNGEPVELDSAAFIENGRTYLPLRFIVENLGAEVAWNEAAQTVTIVCE